jgi:transposase
VITHGELFMIHKLRDDGLSISEIARRTGYDRKTIRKYLRAGTQVPVYGPRKPRGSILDPFKDYIRQQLRDYPGLSASRLMREITTLGYRGAMTTVKSFVLEVRPPRVQGYEHRFETPPGKQAQVDFAHFKVRFTDEPSIKQAVWLFSMVLGNSRYMFCRFATNQALPTVIRCHMQAFERFGGIPREILYDRMKTAVTGDDDSGRVLFNTTLLALADHYGFRPRACAPYRAKTKGKVERPFRYIRQDFFLGRRFRNLEDLNEQLDRWLADVANSRRHGTTDRIVNEAFAEELPALQALPAGPFNQVLSLERRITRDGMVSIGGNFYSVPDTTTKRRVEVQVTATEIQVLEAGQLIATHPVMDGRRHRLIAEGHRHCQPPGNARTQRQEKVLIDDSLVAQRDLAVYDSIAATLARGES